jgi:hypothetical protein
VEDDDYGNLDAMIAPVVSILFDWKYSLIPFEITERWMQPRQIIDQVLNLDFLILRSGIQFNVQQLL